MTNHHSPVYSLDRNNLFLVLLLGFTWFLSVMSLADMWWYHLLFFFSLLIRWPILDKLLFSSAELWRMKSEIQGVNPRSTLPMCSSLSASGTEFKHEGSAASASVHDDLMFPSVTTFYLCSCHVHCTELFLSVFIKWWCSKKEEDQTETCYINHWVIIAWC